MLTFGFGQRDAFEARGLTEYVDIMEADGLDNQGIRLVLYIDGQRLGEQCLCCLIPVIWMGVRHDDGIYRKNVFHRRHKLNCRVLEMVVGGAGESWVGVFWRQHRVHEESFTGVLNNECGVANLGDLHLSWLRLSAGFS